MSGMSGMSGTFNTIIQLIYLLAASCFVLGLHLMNTPATARRGNQVSVAGMIAAIVATFVLVIHLGGITATGWVVIVAGIGVGGGLGLYAARSVKMTAMPQLVSIFNAVGGGAAALVAIRDFMTLGASVPAHTSVPTVLDVIIGAVTFSGSIIAAGKLQGLITSAPVAIPGGRIINVTLVAIAVAAGGFVIASPGMLGLGIVIVASLAFGVTMVMPIGGADMPVVISLLNAFTGTAVAMAGFVIDNTGLIIAGALVGASGGILTKLMADAMNRSIGNIMIGGFGSGDAAAVTAGPGGAAVQSIAADDAAIQLAYASKVVIVPGYGLAAAQAQHEVAALADLLESRGVDVSYAIHPVAGRMPGHMNVLLAEANVPYPLLKEMDEVNPEFSRTDVALVIGANDVTNPAARRAGTAISGMPILDVDNAKSIIVIKRSMGHGYAGIDNELYTNPKTSMFFADAKKGLAELTASVKTLVA
jgi:H+-translocating NAD(P) transhydrogenase subunit beta